MIVLLNWRKKLRPEKGLMMIISFFVFSSVFSQQYYLRGEVKDENNNALSNAKILLHSNNYLYYSDTSGSFEILIGDKTDSVTVTASGFKPLLMQLEAGQYQYIILDSQNNLKGNGGKKLACLTKNFQPEIPKTTGSDLRNSLVENNFVETKTFPETEFVVNPEKKSFDNFQRYINLNSTVPPDAIRIEELLNYFNLDYHEPPADSNFSFASYLTQCPWNENDQLLLLHANAKKIDLDKIPPANLVFLIDLSGSMGLPNRLPLLKSALRFFTGMLREKDTISMVTYGKSASVWLRSTPGNRKKEILKAIEQLQAGGSMPGDVAIKEAYAISENQFISEGNNRIILATDGDFNNGQSTQEELEKLIMMHKRWGIYLSCFGISMDDKKNERLQVLVERGGGNMTYIDDEQNAEKALMREFAQIVYSVADNAYFNIQLDSNLVGRYRVIGFENRIDALSDRSNQIGGGQISSGSSITAMVELTPTPDSVRRQFVGTSIGSIQLHYKLAGDSTKMISYYDLPSKLTKFSALPASYRFASSVAWSGLLMKNSSFINSSSWHDAVSLVAQSYNNKDVLQKEFINLIQVAKKIYSK